METSVLMECLKPLCLVEVSRTFIQVHTDTLKISNVLLVETASVEFPLHLGVGKAFGYFDTFPNSQRQCLILHSLHAHTGFGDNSHISSDFPMPVEFP